MRKFISVKRSVPIFFLLFAVTVSIFGQTRTQTQIQIKAARESSTIAKIRNLPASKLDPKLPARPFESWLKDVLGPGSALKWEMNDCGEQTGDPKLDADRDFPTCVEVDGENPHGDAKVVVFIAVGSVNKGIAGRPQLWFASIEFPNRLLIPDQLRCLPAILNDPAYRSPGGPLNRQSGCKITEGKK